MENIVNYNTANINIYKDKYLASVEVVKQLVNLNKKKCSNIALSGGSSPILLFEIMRDNYSKKDFSNLKFYWVDERYVEKSDEQSNFGKFEKILIDTNIIERKNVFPMYKKNNEKRDKRIIEISTKIKENISFKNNLPVFDLILLGIGNDGHTASLFPDNLDILEDNNIILKTINPNNKQKRLTLSKNVINNANKIFFLVFGQEKAIIVKEILEYSNKGLPSSYIKKDNSVSLYLDKYSAILLSQLK